MAIPKRRRMGRPREFRRRVGFMVLLDAAELKSLRARARADGLSASRFVRVLIQKALGISTTKTRRD